MREEGLSLSLSLPPSLFFFFLSRRVKPSGERGAERNREHEPETKRSARTGQKQEEQKREEEKEQKKEQEACARGVGCKRFAGVCAGNVRLLLSCSPTF